MLWINNLIKIDEFVSLLLLAVAVLMMISLWLRLSRVLNKGLQLRPCQLSHVTVCCNIEQGLQCSCNVTMTAIETTSAAMIICNIKQGS